MSPPTSRVALVWDDRFTDYDLGPTHPFRMEHRELAARLAEAVPAVDPAARIHRVHPVAEAPMEELRRFHTAGYLAHVEAASEASIAPPLDAGDTPAFPGCFPAAARVVGGTLAALAAVETGQAGRAINPSGGLHHAHASRASGFCIFNDLAVAIARALDGPSGWRRVAYVDIDAHHGDGVLYGFYRDGRVLDIDFHQDGRTIFPGTGRTDETGEGDGAGLTVNVPLPPGAGDEAIVPLFRSIVPEMLRSFRPDLIVLQHGMDAHAHDLLAQLQYTEDAYRAVLGETLGLAEELTGGRLLVTGGGGYLAENVALGLAGAALQMTGTYDPRGTLPPSWREEFLRRIGRDAPRTFASTLPVSPSPWNRARTDRMLDELGRALGRRFPRAT